MGTHSKVAIVTGAAKGIGRAISERLAADGFSIAAVDIIPAADTVKTITDKGGKAASYLCDVSKVEQVNATVAKIAEEMGTIGILINNAGLHPTPPTLLENVSDELWHKMVAVDLDSMFYFARACIPMMKAEKWGRIINFASAVVDGPTPPGGTHYAAVKAGAVGLTRGLAIELGDFFITCNAIAPGATETPGLDPAGTGEIIKFASADQLIKKYIQPHHIASAAAWLVSDEAEMVTSQVIHVDGGVTRT